MQRKLVAPLAIATLLLAACGGGSAATQPPAGATSSTGGGAATEIPNEPPEATEAGGGGGGGGSNLDVETTGKALVPPNSTEITKTTAEDTWFVAYTSTDSIDSLKSYYEGAIARAGLKIFSTTTVSGGISYVIATDENGSFGGAVNIYPNGDGTVSVQITIAKS
jgi:hypothetical protein